MGIPKKTSDHLRTFPAGNRRKKSDREKRKETEAAKHVSNGKKTTHVSKRGVVEKDCRGRLPDREPRKEKRTRKRRSGLQRPKGSGEEGTRGSIFGGNGENTKGKKKFESIKGFKGKERGGRGSQKFKG